RTRQSDGPISTLSELHRVGGVVRDAGGAPVRDAWVAMPETGRWTATDADGRFRLARVPAGDQRVVVRTAAGLEAEAVLTVPGAPADVVVGGGAEQRSSKRKR